MQFGCTQIRFNKKQIKTTHEAEPLFLYLQRNSKCIFYGGFMDCRNCFKWSSFSLHRLGSPLWKSVSSWRGSQSLHLLNHLWTPSWTMRRHIFHTKIFVDPEAASERPWILCWWSSGLGQCLLHPTVWKRTVPAHGAPPLMKPHLKRQ